MIVVLLKLLCLINFFGFLYRLQNIIYTLYYIRDICLENLGSFIVIFICIIFIYIVYVLMSYIIEQQVRILRELSELKHIMQEN